MSLSHLSARELTRLDAVCFDFEQQLRNGQSPDIEAWVQRHGGDHAAELRNELQAVAIEIASQARQPDLLNSRSLIAANNHSTGQMKLADEAASGLRVRDEAGWLAHGVMLGPYRIGEQIGRGGMGEVYRGRDERLGRDVAIKILQEDWARKIDRGERFDREARAVATLSHPNIVGLYDVGRFQGRPYAVMELLRGETLRDRLRNGSKMPAAEVRRLGAAAADALAAAHAAGIIHRDLKPENLFLTQDGTIKLLDFGLSRSSSNEDGGSRATETGVILGTMGYLSPEQADGQKVTPAVDIFSLGCVLHECFYGRRAFNGATIAESIAAVMKGHPEPDSVIAATDEELANIIASCLQKSPADRVRDAVLLAQQLRGDGIATPSTPVALAGGVNGYAMNRRTVLKGFGLTAFAAGGVWGLVSLKQVLRQPPVVRSLAVLPLHDGVTHGTPGDGMETRELVVGEELAAAIADQLTRIPNLRVVPFFPLRDNGTSPSNQPLTSSVLPKYVKELADLLDVDAVLVGSVSSDGEGFQTIDVTLVDGQTGYQICNYTTRVREKTNLIEQVQTASKVAQGIGRELEIYRSGDTKENGCYHCLVNGYARMDSDSISALRDALLCFQSAISQDEKFPEAFAGLAVTSMLLVSQTELDERTKLVEQARHSADAAIALEPDSGGALLARAMLAWQVDWQFQEASQLFAQCIPRMEDNWVAQHEFALFLLACGRFDEARRHADRAVSLDPTSMAFRIDKARIDWLAGDARGAEAQLRAVIAVSQGKARDTAVGATLDILEELRRWRDAYLLMRENASPELLAELNDPLNDISNGRASPSEYWVARGKAIAEMPYGPYDLELNQFLLAIRRGDEITEEKLLILKGHRPPRLPLLVSTHPAWVEFRNRSSLQELLLDRIFTS
jgi:tetratricopeptide (TPR) repeat protein